MKAPRLTAKRLTALARVCGLAEAELEALEAHDDGKSERARLHTPAEYAAMYDAIEWVRALRRYRAAKAAARGSK